MRKLTERRLKRIEEVISKRQPDLFVALNGIKNPHNASAIARTADAVGIYKIFTDSELLFKASTSKGSQKWVELVWVDNMPLFLRRMKAEGFQIVVTYVHGGVVYTQVDYTKPTVVVVGNEAEGVSEEVLREATVKVWIPMFGMVESLNVSVATAVILYEAQRQRIEKGLYSECRLDFATREKLYKKYTS